MRSAKKYTTTYKKKVDVEKDAYLPKLSPKGLVVCPGCGAVYHRQRWTLSPPQEIGARVEAGQGIRRSRCPACAKVRDHYPSGDFVIEHVTPAERGEVLRLIQNEERRAREKNPLSRIMSIRNLNQGLRVETTTEKLAQRLARSLRKAHGGTVRYQWSHNNKFVRVKWSREKRGEKALRG